MIRWLISLLVILAWRWVPHSPLFLTLFVESAGCAWWTWLIMTSFQADRRFWKVVCAAAAIRFCAAFFLFFTSAYRWPFFVSSQHEIPGFWNFAMDAVASHTYALSILNSFLTRIPYPEFTSASIEYYLWLACVYRVFGAHPLIGIIVNIWFSVLQVIFVVWIVRQVAGSKRGIVAGWLIAFWPSSVFWATQLLKDSMNCFMIIGVFASVATLWRFLQQGQKVPRAVRIVWWLFLALCIGGVTKLRSYMGMVLAFSIASAFGVALFTRLFRKQYFVAVHIIIIILIASGSMVFAYQYPYPQVWFKIKLSSVIEAAPVVKQVLAPPPKIMGEKPSLQIEIVTSGDVRNRVQVIDPFRVVLDMSSDKIQVINPSRVVLDMSSDKIQVIDPSRVVLDMSSDKIQVIDPSRVVLNMSSDKQRISSEKLAQEPSEDDAFKMARYGSLVVNHPKWATVRRPSSIGAVRRGFLHRKAITIVRPSRVILEAPSLIRVYNLADFFILKIIRKGSSEDTVSAGEPFKKSLCAQWWPIPDLFLFSRGILEGVDELENLRYGYADPSRIRKSYRAFLKEPKSVEIRFPVRVIFEIRRKDPAGKEVIENVTIWKPRRLWLDKPSEVVIERPSHWASVEIVQPLRLWTPPVFKMWPLSDFKSAFDLMEEHVRAITSSFSEQASVSKFMQVRKGIASEGGRSLLYPKVVFSSLSDVAKFVPKAFLIAWFAPFPNQWFDTEGISGIFRIFAAFETLLFYVLLPWFLRGVWQVLRLHSPGASTLFIFIVLASLLLGLTIPNVGTLFRLRYPVILISLVMAGFALEKGTLPP